MMTGAGGEKQIKRLKIKRRKSKMETKKKKV